MKQAFMTMLEMQDSMNQRVHPQWFAQNYEWYRAIWIECGELVEHYGYKWWKKQEPDMDQVRLEVIDIWHFGMSALFSADKTKDQVADEMVAALDQYAYTKVDVRKATEALAIHSLQSQGFSVKLFWDLLHSVDLDFEQLYKQYVGKNVLNFFRQDHGYKDGSYIKQWSGREDNEHLVEILNLLDSNADSFKEDVYCALTERYPSVTETA